MKRAVKLIVSGVVQGVFFRSFIKENADKLGIVGYVRNLEGGDIEIFLEGEMNKVNEMIKICQRGPEHSKIKEVKIIEGKVQDFKEFKILRF